MDMARTVLEQKIRQRRQTLQEFTEYAERFARERGEPGTLSTRHLQRLVAGQAGTGSSAGKLRPATARLLEAIFEIDIDVLLGPPDRVSEDVGTRELAGASFGHASRVGATPAVQTPGFRNDLAQSFAWVDDQTAWRPETTRRMVTARLGTLSTDELLTRGAQRRNIGRSRIAAAMADYYQPIQTGWHLYRADFGGIEALTSVLTTERWLDLACPLGAGMDRIAWSGDEVGAPDRVSPEHAVERLAEATAVGVRMTNASLYRLLDIDIQTGAINGLVAEVPFVEYATTMDLLEQELIDALATGSANKANLPLRRQYLPEIGTVLDLPGRVCAGGVPALCAIARPADAYRGERDFALLVQRRSGHVLNAPHRLSVIPKGFHQPLTDVNADAQLASTLLREMEEELLGRSEVDNTVSGTSAAVPLHPARMSEPMRWLLADPSRMRMECTGFGLNLVSGNFEFASLIVIDDDEFWTRYGGQIEANWEAAGLQLYSSLDADLVSQLIADESWCNEGLFALVQGIRRLRDIGDERVQL